MQEVRKFIARNGEEITLRPASPEDAGKIISTVRSTSEERSYILMEIYGKDADSVKSYLGEMDRRHNLFLVAHAQDAVIGSLAALQADGGHRPQTSHNINLGMHLIKDYRGLGIGSQMLDYAVEWAREHGFKKLEASIFTTNRRSLHLFSNAGFTEEGTRRKRIRIGKDYIDEVFMGRLLE